MEERGAAGLRERLGELEAPDVINAAECPDVIIAVEYPDVINAVKYPGVINAVECPDVINAVECSDVIKAVEGSDVIHTVMNKYVSTSESHDIFEASAEAENSLDKAEARLDRLEGVVSVGEAGEVVCLAFWLGGI